MHARPMLPSDCAALAALFAEISAQLDPREELARDLARAWVMEEAPGSGALAVALGWQVVDELELLALGTVPAARRRGVARALLGVVLEAARAAGLRRITLEVAASNVAARRLYEATGFAVFNVRRGYYARTGDDALELELRL